MEVLRRCLRHDPDHTLVSGGGGGVERIWKPLRRKAQGVVVKARPLYQAEVAGLASRLLVAGGGGGESFC